MTDKTPQELAEENAHLVKASDDVAREAAGKPHPVEGADVRDLHPERYDEQGRPLLGEGWHYGEDGKPVEESP